MIIRGGSAATEGNAGGEGEEEEVALEMSHYSIQEVEQRPGVHGYQATGPILPDRLRGKRGGGEGWEQQQRRRQRGEGK